MNPYQPENTLPARENILIVEDEFVVAHDLQVILERAGYSIAGIAGSVIEALSLLGKTRPDLVLLDIYLKGKHNGIDLAKRLKRMSIPFIYISANSNEKILEAAKETAPYGFIVKPYREADLLTSIDIARHRIRQVSMFKNSGRIFLEGFLNGLPDVPTGPGQMLLKLAGVFQPYLPFDFFLIRVAGTKVGTFAEICVSRTSFNEYQITPAWPFLRQAGIEPGRQTTLETCAGILEEGIYNNSVFIEQCSSSENTKLLAKFYMLKSKLARIVSFSEREPVLLLFFSRLERVYEQQHLDLINEFASLLTNCIYEKLVSDITGIDIGIDARNLELPIEFEHLVGKSPAFLKVLDQIRIVAPTDTAVLITGASGTGKENVAWNLHKLSARKDAPMITVNCAALPSELIESILFGHEKGSFTGATESRMGKFEEANGGTLFLDEIGEMPVTLQSKLLRVLQDREVQRIGAAEAFPVDIRIIAATSRNLEKEIASGRFRLDLYYRLHVFPIAIPALRDRPEDIGLLIDYFIPIYEERFRKGVIGMSVQLRNQLTAYSWPGNVRELEHLIERSVLLCQSAIIDDNLLSDLPHLSPPNQRSENAVKTIAENERDHIIAILKKCQGRISGPGGAAELLGVPATTLSSKLKKFGISRQL